MYVFYSYSPEAELIDEIDDRIKEWKARTPAMERRLAEALVMEIEAEKVERGKKDYKIWWRSNLLGPEVN